MIPPFSCTRSCTGTEAGHFLTIPKPIGQTRKSWACPKPKPPPRPLSKTKSWYIYRNKISCAYWLLSVNCLLGSHYLNEGVSHHRQISSLLNRILAPFTCHQENSSITTLRASLPTTIIILSDVFLVDGFLHICPPSEDSLFVARGSILFYAWIAWCGPNWVVTYVTSGPFLKVLQDLVIPPL